jgi:hypothetical protein
VGGLDQALEHFVDRQLRRDREHRVADRSEGRAQAFGHPVDDSFGDVMPRFWLWTTVLALVFVLAGMVIAITKLA